MSKRLFHAEGVPTEPQVSGLPDFTDESVIEANPYIMRGRLTSGLSRGVWSAINLPDYQYDTDTDSNWASGSNASKLYKQLSVIASNPVTSSKFYDTSANSYIEYVKEVTVNLDEVAAQNAPTTGVDVWFRWMPSNAFQTFTFTTPGNLINGLAPPTYDFVDAPAQLDDIPSGGWQLNGMSSIDQNYSVNPYWEPTEWSFVGTRFATSFSVAIPIPQEYRDWEGYWEGLGGGKPADGFRKLHVNDYFNDVWFQILVTGHSSWKPDRFNYRWIGNTDQYTSSDFDTGMWATYQRYWSEGAANGAINNSKVGEFFTDTRVEAGNYRTAGYLPWNPHYGMTKSDQWNTYRRQRTTFGDIAIFAPRRWRNVFEI